MKKISGSLIFIIIIIALATAFLIVRQAWARGSAAPASTSDPHLGLTAGLDEPAAAECSGCHAPETTFYSSQDFNPGLQVIDPALLDGEAAGQPTVLAPTGHYSPIYSNDTLVGLWVSARGEIAELQH